MPLPLRKFRGLILAACVGVMASAVMAHHRPISGDLPRDHDAATQVIQLRVDQMFPDGTPAEQLYGALRAERFHMTSEQRGLTTPTSDGRHFVNKSVRYSFVCGSNVQVNWQQRDGQVFDIVGRLHQGCL